MGIIEFIEKFHDGEIQPFHRGVLEHIATRRRKPGLAQELHRMHPKPKLTGYSPDMIIIDDPIKNDD